MKKIPVYFLLLLLVAKMAVITTGCANIIPPDGGPRDSLPPVLIKTNPSDSTRNFSGNKIIFTFDEFVDVQAVSENVNISPSLKDQPTVDAHLNTVTFKLNGKLDPNTTYFINFGNAIRDFNEGNIYKNFSYTFSTGPYIDSLELTGNVILAQTGKIDTTLIVMLHTSDKDSALINEKPRYVTKLDSKGNFVFKNLPPRKFYLYALKDENGSRVYYAQNSDNLFAFASQPVQPGDSASGITLYAYADSKTAPPDRTTPPITNNRLGKSNTGPDNRLKFQTNLANNQLDLLGSFIMSFDKLLSRFDSTKARLYTDSTFIPVTGYRFQKDSSGKKIELINNWKENTLYHLILDKDFARDTSGKQLLRTDTLDFTTKKLADYGSLKMKFRNLDFSKNPVLLIMSGETIVKSTKLSGPDFSASLFNPGEYELRILFDENKNGIWDPGEFFGKHKQPELVKPIERKINVKANWQNEFDIEAPH